MPQSPHIENDGVSGDNCGMEFRLRNIPDDLWRRFKAQCVLDGKTLTEALIDAIRREVAAKEKKR